MTTWYITATARKPNRGTIENYLCQKVLGSRIAAGEWKTRHDVARAILAGDEFWTARQASDGLWYQRARVEIHITTEPNASVSDNLESLPSVG
jgi:hypothetical protein